MEVVVTIDMSMPIEFKTEIAVIIDMQPIECSHFCARGAAAAAGADMRTRKQRDNCSTSSQISGCEHFGPFSADERCS